MRIERIKMDAEVIFWRIVRWLCFWRRGAVLSVEYLTADMTAGETDCTVALTLEQDPSACAFFVQGQRRAEVSVVGPDWITVERQDATEAETFHVTVVEFDRRQVTVERSPRRRTLCRDIVSAAARDGEGKGEGEK